MHALARAPSFTVSRSPSAARSRRTRAPAQAESSSAKAPSRPEQAMATAERASSRGARNATTAERLTYEARTKSRGKRRSAGVWKEGGVECWERGEEASLPKTVLIALVPFVVVQAMSLPWTACLVNSSGELPKSKPSGLAAFRSPARRARPACECASGMVAQGMMARAPCASATAADDVKRRTSMTTLTSASTRVAVRETLTNTGGGGLQGFRRAEEWSVG